MIDKVTIYGLEMVFEDGEMVDATIQQAVSGSQIFVIFQFNAAPLQKALEELREKLHGLGEVLEKSITVESNCGGDGLT